MEIKLQGGQVLYRSQPKQTEFHEAIRHRRRTGKTKFLYGGAAGGGKSHALRWQAIYECLKYAGIRVLLLRSSYPELERTHIQSITKELPLQMGKYNDQKKKYTFENGSVIQFGHGEHKRDFKKYLSDQYEVILIDEQTTIPFDLILLLFSRIRTVRQDFLPYAAGGTNPGDIGHVHVKSFYIDKDFGAEFPDMASAYNAGEVYFLAAKVYDNEILMRNDPGYVKRLEALSPYDRARFLDGSWEIFEGQYFEKMSRVIHVISLSDARRLAKGEVKWGVGIDYGNVNCAYLGYMTRDRQVVITNEWTEYRQTTEHKARSFGNWLRRCAEEWGFKTGDIRVWADTNMFAEWAETKKSFAGEWKKVFRDMGADIKLISVVKRGVDNRKFRISANKYVEQMLEWQRDKNGLWVKKPKLYFIDGRCQNLWKTMPMLVRDPQTPEDILETDTDHWYDALKYLLYSINPPADAKRDREVIEKLKRMQEEKPY